MGSLDIQLAKQQFLSLMEAVSEQQLPQFTIWLDIKLAEYKILGQVSGCDDEEEYPTWIRSALRHHFQNVFGVQEDGTPVVTGSRKRKPTVVNKIPGPSPANLSHLKRTVQVISPDSSPLPMPAFVTAASSLAPSCTRNSDLIVAEEEEEEEEEDSSVFGVKIQTEQGLDLSRSAACSIEERHTDVKPGIVAFQTNMRRSTDDQHIRVERDKPPLSNFEIPRYIHPLEIVHGSSEEKDEKFGIDRVYSLGEDDISQHVPKSVGVAGCNTSTVLPAQMFNASGNGKSSVESQRLSCLPQRMENKPQKVTSKPIHKEHQPAAEPIAVDDISTRLLKKAKVNLRNSVLKKKPRGGGRRMMSIDSAKNHPPSLKVWLGRMQGVATPDITSMSLEMLDEVLARYFSQMRRSDGTELSRYAFSGRIPSTLGSLSKMRKMPKSSVLKISDFPLAKEVCAIKLGSEAIALIS